MAFNVGLFMVLTYTMLNASDIQVAGQLIQIGAQQFKVDIPWQPYTVLWLAVLMYQVWSKGVTETNRTRLMCLSLFWHFLDIVWICVFTVVYLMGFL